jgi:hypothetical protein
MTIGQFRGDGIHQFYPVSVACAEAMGIDHRAVILDD